MKLFITQDYAPICLTDNVSSIRLDVQKPSDKLIDVITITIPTEPDWFIVGPVDDLRQLMHRIAEAFKVDANIISVPLDYADWDLKLLFSFAELEKHIVQSHNYMEQESLTL